MKKVATRHYQSEENMKKIELHVVQSLQLETLREISRICKKNDIRYYLIGGSLIGAIRNKGFIPWDDDIDIAMMRSDYQRFLSCCPGELNNKYFLQNYQTDKDFRPAITRICILGTYIKDEFINHLKCNKSLYLDIFPLDDFPDDEIQQLKKIKRINMIDKLILFKLCIVFEKGPLFTKLIAKKILKGLLIAVPLKTLQQLREKEMLEFSMQNTINVCSTASKYNLKKQIIKRSFYGEPVLLEFEGEMFYAPREWDAILRKVYGDYMELPSEDERKPINDVYELE